MIVSKGPSKVVGGTELGEGFWEVHITKVLKPNQELMRPIGRVKKLGDALEMGIAWPSGDVCL